LYGQQGVYSSLARGGLNVLPQVGDLT